MPPVTANAGYLTHVDTIVRETDAIAAHVVTADLDRPIPSCPGWNLGQLVRHLGQVHRFARSLLDHTDPTEMSEPHTARQLANWLRHGARALSTTLRSTDPETPVWTFDVPPGQAWFWARRQAIETALHRWDSEPVADRTPVDTATAMAGLDEAVGVLLPRAIVAGDAVLPEQPIRLSAHGRSWVIGRPVDANATTIEANDSDLLLLVWGRRTPHQLVGPINGLDWSGVRLLA